MGFGLHCGPARSMPHQSLRIFWIADLEKYCVNTFAVYITHSVTDVAVDLVILIIPIPHVSCLRIQPFVGVRCMLMCKGLGIANDCDGSSLYWLSY